MVTQHIEVGNRIAFELFGIMYEGAVIELHGSTWRVYCPGGRGNVYVNVNNETIQKVQ